MAVTLPDRHLADRTVVHQWRIDDADRVTFDRELARGSADRLRRKRRELSALEPPFGRGWEPAQEAVACVVCDPPGGIAAVIAKLEALQSILDDLPPERGGNRVAAFNDLYLTITRRVAAALRDDAEEPEFLELLDVEFAKRYLDAVDRWNRDDEDTPDVWEVLFKRARDQRMSRLAAAMLGVNAHINHDLALALVATWNDLGAPEDDVISHDYLLVDQIFYEEIPLLRHGYSTEWQLEIDRLAGPLDDWSQRMLVTVTRAHAWDQALRLWTVREDEGDFEQACRLMDRAAALVGEWLVVTDRLVTVTDAVTAGPEFLRRPRA
jgi:Family of unknown function (DUF5995)